MHILFSFIPKISYFPTFLPSMTESLAANVIKPVLTELIADVIVRTFSSKAMSGSYAIIADIPSGIDFV